MDFTLKKYSQLLKAIGRGDCTLKSYLAGNQRIILRHDVDRSLGNALKMAKLEAKHGISASYYFRVPKTFNVAVINKIAQMGHEIGYHYECLDKAKGDYDKAIEIFKKELELFWKWDIKTVCMHGNPLTKWDNKEIWNHTNLKEHGLLGEAYLSIDFSKINYFTDTGRRWNSKKYSVKDKTTSQLININSTDDLIQKIKTSAYILTHPCRWNDSYTLWLKELVWQNVKNVGKRVLK